MNSDYDRQERFRSIADEVFEPLQRYLRRRIQADRSEDVLADVMLTVWRRLDDVPEDRALPWCYGVARRTLANELRGQKRRLRLVERMESERPPTAESNPAEMGPDPDLATALDALHAEDREILHLWAWEQLEPRELAPVLGISVNAATLRLGRARKRLAKELTRQDLTGSGHETVDGTRSNHE